MRRDATRSSILAVLTLLACLASAGCQGDSDGTLPGTEPVQRGMDGLDSGEYAVLDFEDAMEAVQDASLEEPMQMDPELCSGDALQAGQRFGLQAPPCRGLPRWARVKWGNHLGAILRAMALTPEQREQVRGLMADHRACVRGPLAAVCENSRETIAEANMERREIVEAARRGEISREEAHGLIQELNRQTRQAIRELPENREPFLALCDCKLGLFDDLRALLDEEQQAVWDAWVAMLEGPCFQGE